MLPDCRHELPVDHSGGRPAFVNAHVGFAALDCTLADGNGHILIAEKVSGFLFHHKALPVRQQLNENKLREIIKKPRVEVIDVNQNVARKYALIYLSLVKKGTKMPINDVWIAA